MFDLIKSLLEKPSLVTRSKIAQKLTKSHISVNKVLMKRLPVGLIFGIALIGCSYVKAQSVAQNSTMGTTSTGASPGRPKGSYGLSDIESVNLYGGRVNVALPLLKIGGRGRADITLSTNVDQSIWTTEYESGGIYANDSDKERITWTKPSKLHSGFVQRRTTRVEPFNPFPVDPETDPPTQWKAGITLLVYIAPDGTEHFLYDEMTGGLPSTWIDGVQDYDPSPVRGKIFIARDGSGLTYIADTTDEDYLSIDLSYTSGNQVPAYEGYPNGYLKTKDGMISRVEDGFVRWTRDRNGNQTTFTYSASNNINLQTLTKITDSNGREYHLTPNGSSIQITYLGVYGIQHTITLNYGYLSNNLRPNSGYQTGDRLSLFPVYQSNGYPESFANRTTQYNPIVLASIAFQPANRTYSFSYNPYGELARLETPDGAAVEYDYGAGFEPNLSLKRYASGQVGSTSLGPAVNAANPDVYIYRRLLERREYANGGTTATLKTFYGRVGENNSKMTVEQVDPGNNNVLMRSDHYFYGVPWARLGTGGFELGYPTNPLEGREWKTENLRVSDNSVLARTENQWMCPAAYSTYGLECTFIPYDSNSPKSANLITTTSSLLDTSTGQYKISKKEFDYDNFDNQTDTREYDFGTGASGTQVRHTHINYVTDTNYTAATGRHLRGLPLNSQIYSVSGGTETLIAQSATDYDETAYGILPSGSAYGWVDPSTNYRGNPTTIRAWLNTNGSWLASHLRYDNFGNLRQAWDAKGNMTETFYDSAYYAFPIQTKTAVPDPSGVYGSSSELITTTAFDYYSGVPTSVTDPNNNTTTTEYDSLLRPIRITPPAGGSVSEIEYHDTPGDLWVKTRVRRDANTWIESYKFFDGLSRPVRTSMQTDGVSNVTPSKTWLINETQYDALGRIWRVSNPWSGTSYNTSGNPSGLWTASTYDSVGRLLTVTSADSAQETTVYSGNIIAVTDQNSKQRKSANDALGRLTTVWEDSIEANNPNGLNYQTDYTYDALDNLRTVTQGTQTRTFVYDSLKRLRSATNPESGTLNYTYDNNGNLLTRTDARGVVTTYTYDNLNRNTVVSYSDGTAPVVHWYDALPNGKGRLWKTRTGVGGTGSRTDITGYDALGRPTGQSQYFQLNGGGAWSAAYTTTVAYDLLGNVTQQTYPSGNVVTYSYDATGRWADTDAQHPAFAGNLGYNGSQRVYVQSVRYNEQGWRFQEGYGTTTPVYNKSFYNSRGQLAEIRVSTTPTDTSWNRGAIINHYSHQCWGQCGGGASGQAMPDNNGNLKKQEIYIPHDDAVSGYTSWYQQYDYDPLNRLQRVHEYTAGGVNDWQQEYVYDRWGNRTVHQTNTYGYGIPKPNYGVNAANNRLTLGSGQTGTLTYDAAGNQTYDDLTGQGAREFDGENKLKRAWSNNQWQEYIYNGDGQRVRRKVNGVWRWQVYGMGGELLAEYAENAAPAAPEQEYGYRAGQLLITVEAALPQVYSNQPGGGGPISYGGGEVSWLIPDQLGTPRLIVGQMGSLSGVKRHDYLPFGEELFAGMGVRSGARGYGGADAVRQQFTGYERDDETGLDYARARYYSPLMGRFASVDPLLSSGRGVEPQSWNRYTYCLNQPLILTDPTGLDWGVSKDDNGDYYHYFQGPVGYYNGRLYTPVNFGRSGVLIIQDHDLGLVALSNNREHLYHELASDGPENDGTGSSLYGAKFAAAMKPYLPALERSMTYMWMYMALFTGPVSEAGELTTLGLEGVEAGSGEATTVIEAAAASRCFVAGTLVHTAEGLLPIEAIKAGMKVLSFNERTQHNEYQTVVRTFVNHAASLFEIKIEGQPEPIIVTNGHPFYAHRARSDLSADAGEWINSDALAAGDSVRRPDGSWVKVLALHRVFGAAAVYNFEVEQNHDYFVGSSGILVHNQTTCESILMPNGQPVGQAGSNPAIREVTGTANDAQTMFDQLTQGGNVLNKPTYPGTITQVPEGGTIGIRTTMTRSPGTNATIDVNVPHIPIDKVKFNPH